MLPQYPSYLLTKAMRSTSVSTITIQNVRPIGKTSAGSQCIGRAYANSNTKTSTANIFKKRAYMSCREQGLQENPSVDRRLGGNNRRRRPQSGNRFRFRFVFVSCVRASGRGEAVWACERGVFVNAGGLHSNISSGRGFALGFVFSFLLLFTWVLSFFRTDCCYAHGLFDLFLIFMVCSWVF